MIVTWVGTTILIAAFIILVTGNPKYYVEGDFLIGKPLLVLPPLNPLIKIPISEIVKVQLSSSRWFSGRRSGWRQKKTWYCTVSTKTNKSVVFPIYDDTKFSDMIKKLHQKNQYINWDHKLKEQIENENLIQLPRSRPIPLNTMIFTLILLLVWFLIVGIPEIVKQLTSY